MDDSARQLFKLTETLGQCVGRMDSFCESQRELNTKIQENIEKLDAKHDGEHDKARSRLSDLENSRTKLYAVIGASSLTSGSIAAWLSKILGIGVTGN